MNRAVICLALILATFTQLDNTFKLLPNYDPPTQNNYQSPPSPPQPPTPSASSSSSSLWSQQLLSAQLRNNPTFSAPKSNQPSFISVDGVIQLPLQPQNLQPSLSIAPQQFDQAKRIRSEQIKKQQSMMYQQIQPPQYNSQVNQGSHSSSNLKNFIQPPCHPYPLCVRQSCKICVLIYYANTNFALTRLSNNNLRFIQSPNVNKQTQLFTLEQHNFQSTWRISIGGQYLTDINNSGWWWSTAVVGLTAVPTWHSNWYLEQSPSINGYLTHVQNVANVYSYWRVCPWNINGLLNNGLCTRVLKHSHRFRFVHYPCQRKYQWNW